MRQEGQVGVELNGRKALSSQHRWSQLISRWTNTVFHPSPLQEGFDALDPFLPILISNYNPKEFESSFQYYLENNWLQHEKGQSCVHSSAALLTAQSAELVHRAFWYHHDLGTRSLFWLTASASEGSAVTTWLHDLACVGAEGVHVSEDRKQRGREKGKA